MTGRSKTFAGFIVLFLAYQAPEGVGQRVLGSFAWQAVLLASFFVIAWLVARWRREPTVRVYALSPARSGLAAAFFASAVGALLIAVPFTFLPSLAEDLLTRGYVYGAKPPGAGAAFIVLSAALYVVNHVFRLRLGPAEWLMLFAFGIAYALALARAGSLWPAVGLHWGWNYGNSAVDTVLNLNIASPNGARLISIAAHAALAAGVIALTRHLPAPTRER